jgi:hypothetical protein
LLGLFYFSLCACYTIIKGDKLVKGELWDDWMINIKI